MTTVSLVSSVRNRIPPATWRLAFGLVLLALGAACSASEEVYNARLTPFPEIGGTPAGIGSATATLRGSTLQVNGSFEGLTYRAGRGGDGPQSTTATDAGLYSGTVTGVRGARLFDLEVDAASSGTISGSVDLTPDQIELLKQGRIYAQIDSEAAPEGHLWGWFLQ